MDVQAQIDGYIASQPEAKRRDMATVHRVVLEIAPASRLWFLDGKNEAGKTVSNPNIGYGFQVIDYADGGTRDFYRIGLSANTSGISVYIIGIADKAHLAREYGGRIGKASVTGYCIKFKRLADIDLAVLADAIRYGLERE